MDLWIYRSLIFALAEYGLIIPVQKYGKYQKNLISAILFFLASYQLGEFIFLSELSHFGIRIAIFSTTMLPPLGVFLIERLSGRNLGGRIFLAIGTTFALILLLVPGVIQASQDCFCLVKYAAYTNASNPLIMVWGTYYLSTLTFSMYILGREIYRNKVRKHRKHMILALIAYASFYPTSYLYTVLTGTDLGLLASFMCALALLTAVIMATISIRYEKLKK